MIETRKFVKVQILRTDFIFASTIRGTTSNDTLTGTIGDDIIEALGGSDTINGSAGTDKLYFGSNDGAVDMVGNVFEWCSTKTGYNYPYTPDDGREEQDGSDAGRIMRGGAWSNGKEWSRCAARGGINPLDWSNDFGFRCMRPTSSLGSGS